MKKRRSIWFLAFNFGLLLGLLVPSASADLLYSGGEWDYESGFYGVDYQMGGRVGTVGNGWQWWSDRVLYNGEYFGFGVHNENKFLPNVSHGVRSQEITMTCATGWAGIYRTITVPVGHSIRIEYDAKTTWSEVPVQVFLGVDPNGGLDHSRDSTTTTWYSWGDKEPGEFHRMSETVVSTGPALTVFLAMYHWYPSCSGATLMFDHVQVYDDGSVSSPTATRTPVPPSTPTPQSKGPTVMTR
jgi:hypothetical protein